ncbi:MAG TPA: glycosyltransferase family 9 protein, partial [Azospirillaceae bacterium]|nr:glycosyltransferase family 9 protein [Azospirillaceae bacterium]
DLGPEIADFADTAAIMANLDLCITSCTGPAHLAGALGRPIWIMLYHAADWRWLYDREDSPWYPSARLFRQNRHGTGGWPPVVERIKAALEALAAGDVSQLRPKGPTPPA